MAKRPSAFDPDYAPYGKTDRRGNAAEWRGDFKEAWGQTATEVVKEAKETPWEILGVQPGTSKIEVKRAFRVLAKKWHPDHNADKKEEAAEMFKKIYAAYDILSKS